MYIKSLTLRDFRSWPTFSVQLEPGVSVFVGRNGHGKTNIVEAIGYVAHLASHRVSSDAPLVREGATDARISATAVNDGRELTAHLLIKARGANQAQINRTKCASPREILGVVKTVLFAPEDLALVRGEPAERRKYLDDVLVSRQPRLAGVKSDYEKVLRQRTALLKSAGGSLRRGYNSADGASALATLDVWDAQLAALGAQLIVARTTLLKDLAEHIATAYHTLAPESRPAHVRYQCSATLVDDADLTDVEVVEAALLAQLGATRSKEIERGQTLTGPHRDDVLLLLGSQPAKGFASHGETWSYALSLRLAVFSLLRNDGKNGTDPILILDDVFAELDAKRRQALLGCIVDAEQVLITAAVDGDLPELELSNKFLVQAVEPDQDGNDQAGQLAQRFSQLSLAEPTSTASTADTAGTAEGGEDE